MSLTFSFSVTLRKENTWLMLNGDGFSDERESVNIGELTRAKIYFRRDTDKLFPFPVSTSTTTMY
jgi:hypothetical protein